MNHPLHLRLSALTVTALAIGICLGQSAVVAQGMEHSAPSVPSSRLTIHGLDGKTLTLTADELAALPHMTVTVLNAHTKASETYSGVALADLLAKVGVPLGEKVRGKLFLTGVIAEGTDHYAVLYSLAEIDPTIHTGEVIVADAVNGLKLGGDGAFKMVSTEEPRPARWVRNLTSISLFEATH